MKTINDSVELYRAKYPSYSTYATRLKDLVIQLIEQSGVKVHFVESRAKTPESFGDKIRRPGKTYNNPFEEIPDLVGVRAVLYYSDSVKAVGDLLKSEFEILEEETGHQTTTYGADQFGYLSMHYVVKLHNKRRELPEWQTWREVRAEIQVRTVLQHSWAAVSHALQYKREGDVPLGLRRKLHRLAGLFELADEEFMSIRDEASIISKATRAELLTNPDVVPIDAQSVAHFISQSPEFKHLREQAVIVGFKFVDLTKFDDRKDYIALVVETCHRLRITSIGKLRGILNFDAERFLADMKKKAEGNWYVNDPFLVFLLLIKARPHEFTLEGLLAEGWGDFTANFVLSAAKETK